MLLVTWISRRPRTRFDCVGTVLELAIGWLLGNSAWCTLWAYGWIWIGLDWIGLGYGTIRNQLGIDTLFLALRLTSDNNDTSQRTSHRNRCRLSLLNRSSSTARDTCSVVSPRSSPSRWVFYLEEFRSRGIPGEREQEDPGWERSCVVELWSRIMRGVASMCCDSLGEAVTPCAACPLMGTRQCQSRWAAEASSDRPCVSGLDNGSRSLNQ